MAGLDAYTKLMLHLDGANGSSTFSDSSDSAHTIVSSGGVLISTGQSKFGGASVYFDGSNDSLTIDQHADFDFGTGDFTVDFWICPDSSQSASYPAILSNNPGGWQSGAINMQFSGGGYTNKIRLSVYDYSYSGHLFVSDATVNPAEWTHIALIRESGVIKLYLNGALDNATSAFSGSMNFGLGKTCIGGGTWDGGYYKGYIDEYRVSKGIARWTENFTPPTTAYGQTKITAAMAFRASARSWTISANRVVIDALRDTVASAANAALSARAAQDAASSVRCDARAHTKTTAQAECAAHEVRRAVYAALFGARGNSFCSNPAHPLALVDQGWRIYARNTATGKFLDLGFVARTGSMTKDVRLPAGTYEMEARPCGDLTDEARTRQFWTVIIAADGTGAETMPEIIGMTGSINSAYKRVLSWSVSGDRAAGGVYFGIWLTSDGNPDITTTAPDMTVSGNALINAYSATYAQTSAQYATVAALADYVFGKPATIWLDWSAAATISPENQVAQ